MNRFLVLALGMLLCGPALAQTSACVGTANCAGDPGVNTIHVTGSGSTGEVGGMTANGTPLATVATQAAAAAPSTTVSAEVTRAETAEGTNATAISTEVSRAQAAEALKAPLASPALTGTPTAPTPAAGTNSTQIPTTAFVGTAVGAETTRAETAESTNATAVTTESTRAQVAEATNAANISNEVTRAEASEASIHSLAAAAFPATGGTVYGPVTITGSLTHSGVTVSLGGGVITNAAQPANSAVDIIAPLSGSTYVDNVLTLQNNSVNSSGLSGNAAIRYRASTAQGGYERGATGYSGPTNTAFFPHLLYTEIGNIAAVGDTNDTDWCVVNTHASGAVNLPGTSYKTLCVQGSTGNISFGGPTGATLGWNAATGTLTNLAIASPAAGTPLTFGTPDGVVLRINDAGQTALTSFEFQPGNASTAALLSLTGETNQGMAVRAAGSGQINLQSGSGANGFTMFPNPTGVNAIAVTAGNTTQPAIIGVNGADANVSIRLAPQGAGVVFTASPFQAQGGLAVTGNATVSGLVTSSTLALSGAGSTGEIGGMTAGGVLLPAIPGTLNILTAGILMDGATDQHAKLQALFDANPTATILFPHGAGCVISNGAIYLSDSTGRNFSGKILGAGGCITFTNAGNAADSDIGTQRGFDALPKSNALYGDNSGVSFVTIENMTINAPANGIGIHVANSYGTTFLHNNILGGRWGIVTECTINTTYEKNNFSGQINAAVGLLYLGDTARVWYGSSSAPMTAYWNDSPTFKTNQFSSSVAGGLAMIVDDGSNAEGIRKFEGNTFISNGSAGVQFGYVGRKASPHFIGNNWFEAINYPIRLYSTNAVEGGSGFALPGVTAAQPSGSYTLANFPDGFAYAATMIGNWFVGAINDIDVSGVEGNVTIGGNVSQNHTGYHITSSQGALNISDLGDSIVGGSGTYVNHPYANYNSLVGAAQTTSPTFTGTFSDTGLGGTYTMAPPASTNGNVAVSVPGSGGILFNAVGGVLSYGAGGVTVQATSNSGAMVISPPSVTNGAVNVSTYNTTSGIALNTPSLSLNGNPINGTFSGTSSSIGGSALAAGACASTTVNIAGLTTSMVVDATPATYPGDAYFWKSYASSAGVATVKICAAVAGTPTASAYNLRVIQ